MSAALQSSGPRPSQAVSRLHRRPGPRRGVVAVVMVAALLLVNILIVSIALSGARDQNLSVRRLETIQAFYAAEAGANMAIRELMEGSDEDGDGTAGTISDDANDSNDPALGAAQVVVTSSIDGLDTILTSDGRGGDARRRIQVTLQ
ncbi:MAG: hypothetical protein ACYTJ0_06865 [Planctomycetota bacterium]|jgi:hypothetical protein